ncbi:MAG: hypothetical protein WCS94_11850 [Verrucomicrobiota bacterium]
MKRRAFIKTLGASALSMPFLISQLSSVVGQGGSGASAGRGKLPLRLKLPEDSARVTDVFGGRGDGIYLLGGPVLALKQGVQPPYLNLLVDTSKFQQMKQAICKLGVSPVSTPDLPGNFIRFGYGEQAYNVLNLDLGSYLQMNAAGKNNGLILFAHNFLVYSVRDNWVLDPHGALQSKGPDDKTLLLKPIQQPKSAIQGLEHCLAAAFDGALLKLQPSPAYTQMEEQILNSTVTAEEGASVMSHLLDYSPDLFEVCGFERTAKLLLSPLSLSAGRAAAGIEFDKVVLSLRRRREQGREVGGIEFIAAVDKQMRLRGEGKSAAFGLTEYMVSRGTSLRRTELLVEAMKEALA